MKSKDPAFGLRAAITVVALVVAGLHTLYPRIIVDAVTAGLIILAFLPWLAPIIKSIEVTGLGKLELKVEEVEEKQSLLQVEVNSLRFLVAGFVSDWEYSHLKKLAAPAAFDYKKGADKDDRFINEIIRLRDFGLVKKRIDYALYDIPLSGDLKQYVELTERGKTYLKLREQLEGLAPSLADDRGGR